MSDCAASAASTVDSRNGCRILWWPVVLTFLIESVTCVSRFGLQMESRQDTASTSESITATLVCCRF